MSRAARSVFFFGFYPTVVGLAQLLAPEAMLRLGGLPSTELLVPRLMGMLLIVIGSFYILAGRAELEPFFVWTLGTRLGTGVVVLLLVLVTAAPIACLWFWSLDGAGAVWTWLALRADRRGASHAVGKA
jgi:hypothetical protein